MVCVDGLVDFRLHLSVESLVQEWFLLDHSTKVRLHLIFVHRESSCGASLSFGCSCLPVECFVGGHLACSSCSESVLFNGVRCADKQVLLGLLEGVVDVVGVIIVILLWVHLLVVG